MEQPAKSYAAVAAAASSTPTVNGFAAAEFTSYKGEMAIKLPQKLVDQLAQPFRLTLIGKFSRGRPDLESIRQFMRVQNFGEYYSVGLLDSKHIILKFTGDKDYIRLFSKPQWNVAGRIMRILKWTPDFHVDIESPIVPVWLSFPKLPIHLMNKDFLFQVVSEFGTPLRVDAATLDFRRPSVAKLQVEINLLKPIPHRFWVQQGDQAGFWQYIDIEDPLPQYCSFCSHIGHVEQNCMIKYPDLKGEMKNAKHAATKQYKMPNQGARRQKKQENRKQSKHAPQYQIVQRTVVQEQEKTVDKSESNAIQRPGKEVEAGTPLRQIAMVEIDEKMSRSHTAKEGSAQGTSSTGALRQIEGRDTLSASKIQEGDAQGIKSAWKQINQLPLDDLDITNLQGIKQKGTTIVDDTHKFDVAAGQTVPAVESHVWPMVSTPVNDPGHSEVVKESSQISDEIAFPRELAISNSFGKLSLDIENQNELQYMDLEGFKVRSMGYNSDKDGKVKLTPFQKIKRTRKKKKVFDL